MRFSVAFAVLAFLFLAPGARAQLQHFDSGTLDIDTSGGTRRFAIELAISSRRSRSERD